MTCSWLKYGMTDEKSSKRFVFNNTHYNISIHFDILILCYLYIKPFGELAYLVVMLDLSKEPMEECDVEVEACINVEGSEVMESKSVSLFQNVVQNYTFSLQQNNSLQYTHVEENNRMCIKESLMSRSTNR